MSESAVAVAVASELPLGSQTSVTAAEPEAAAEPAVAITPKDPLVVRARMAEKAERFSDMARAIKTVAEMGLGLTNTERNMFSFAYKNMAGQKRRSWRFIFGMEQQFDGSDPWKLEKIQHFRQKIQQEMQMITREVCSLVDDHLMATAQSDEDKVFYLKMKADYSRYQAEVMGEHDKRKKYTKIAEKIYKEATEVARELRPTHPIRLGLVLNYSVLLFELKASSKKAIKMSREMFEEAMQEFDSGVFREESYKDSVMILGLIKENVKLWGTSNGPVLQIHPPETA